MTTRVDGLMNYTRLGLNEAQKNTYQVLRLSRYQPSLYGLLCMAGRANFVPWDPGILGELARTNIFLIRVLVGRPTARAKEGGGPRERRSGRGGAGRGGKGTL